MENRNDENVKIKIEKTNVERKLKFKEYNKFKRSKKIRPKRVCENSNGVSAPGTGEMVFGPLHGALNNTLVAYLTSEQYGG